MKKILYAFFILFVIIIHSMLELSIYIFLKKVQNINEKNMEVYYEL